MSVDSTSVDLSSVVYLPTLCHPENIQTKRIFTDAESRLLNLSKADVRKIVSQAIQILREERGISQEDLARDSGLSRRHFWGIESGRTDPGTRSTLMICTGLGISYEQWAKEIAKLIALLG